MKFTVSFFTTIVFIICCQFVYAAETEMPPPDNPTMPPPDNPTMLPSMQYFPDEEELSLFPDNLDRLSPMPPPDNPTMLPSMQYFPDEEELSLFPNNLDRLSPMPPPDNPGLILKENKKEIDIDPKGRSSIERRK